MTESKLFVSSCNRRQMARRRSGSWLGAVGFRAHPALIGIALVLIGTAAFLAGQGTI